MLTVHFHKVFNHLLEENMVIARLVNQQVLDFNSFCEYLADGATVTSADCAAVLKQIESRLPFVLAFNSKVICSPEGLCFRPSISGSITQSQLKKKLQERLQDDPTLDIDVNREIQTTDLTIDDLQASIAIDLPKVWHDRFKAKANFKRERTESSAASDTTENAGGSGSNTNPTNGTNTGDNTGGGTNPGTGTDDDDLPGTGG